MLKDEELNIISKDISDINNDINNFYTMIQKKANGNPVKILLFSGLIQRVNNVLLKELNNTIDSETKEIVNILLKAFKVDSVIITRNKEEWEKYKIEKNEK